MPLNYLFDMKKLVGISVLAITAALISPIQSFAAAPKAGTACTKLGSTSIAANKKFTCIKSGKKMVWDKGVAVAKPVTVAPSAATSSSPSPSPSPVVSPAATIFKAKIPISLPVVQNKAVTFANAVDQYALIPQTAWQNVQDAISANQQPEIPTNIVIGPNTDTTLERVTSLLKKAQRLFNGFQQPPSFSALVYNATDESWAETEWTKLAKQLSLTDNPSSYINQLRAGCNFSSGVATECYGGMAGVFEKTDAGFAFMGVQSPFWSVNSSEIGPISQVTHEYTHNVQFAQWLGSSPTPNGRDRVAAFHKVAPCWFSEGQANAIGIPIAASDLNSYMRGRDNSILRRIDESGSSKPALTMNGLTSNAITAFLFGQDIATCYNPTTNNDWQLGYSIGYAATEVLVAIGGPQSTMALLAQTASGQTWAEAFQSVYGISWKDGADILGKVLAAEYAAKPMSTR
jgi:hypothetical protein